MYSVYESDPSLLSPICKLIALLIQSNSNSTQEFEITKAPHIDDFEPKVIAALYETLYGYVANILQDAQLYADHAHHKEILPSDVKLAIETRTSLEFVPPPSRDALTLLAAKKNSIPLPLVQEKFGLRLPPERHLLIKNNITIVPKKRSEVAELHRQQQEQLMPPPVHGMIPPPVTAVRPPPQVHSSINPSPLSKAAFTPTTPSIPKPNAPVDDDYDMD